MILFGCLGRTIAPPRVPQSDCEPKAAEPPRGASLTPPELAPPGTAGYAVVASAGVAGALPVAGCVAMFFFGMNSVVWNDVALDGVTTQKVKEFPSLDVELSSLQQVALMSTAMVMSLLTGFLVDWIGLAWVLALASAFSGVALLAVAFLPEKPDDVPVSVRTVLARSVPPPPHSPPHPHTHPLTH